MELLDGFPFYFLEKGVGSIFKLNLHFDPNSTPVKFCDRVPQGHDIEHLNTW